MSKIIELTKVFLKTSFTKYKGTSNKKEKTVVQKILTGIGIVALVAYMMGVFGFISYEMIDVLVQAGQPAVFLGVALLSIALLLLIQTLIASMNLFYFSKDIEYILPLPLKPHEIVIAKFNTLLVTEYITVFTFLLVPFTIYGILTGAGALFYLYALLILLVFPILPALISCILVMIAMSFSNLTKNKEKFQTIATIVLILAVLAMQMQLTGSEETTNEEMVQMLTQFNGLVEQIDDYFITLGDSINALINYNNISGIHSLLKLVVITAVAYIIFMVISQKLYFRGAVGASYSGKKKREKGANGLSYKKQNIGVTYVKKEFTALFKNSIFFTQCILPSILMPVIVLISSIAGAGGMEELESQGIQSLDISNTIGLCVVTGINTFLFIMNFIAVTAVSRDGENAMFMKYIPLDLSKQCTYKIIPAVIMSMITSCIIVVTGAIMFGASLLFILLNLIIALLLSIFYSYLMIIVDLKHPKLKWDTEYAVVKQNMNMLFEFALSMAIIIILVGIGFAFSQVWYGITAGVLIAVLGLGIYAVKKYISKNQVKLFEKVQ